MDSQGVCDYGKLVHVIINMYVGSQQMVRFHSRMCMVTANIGSREHHYVHMVLLHVLKCIHLDIEFRVYAFIHACIVIANTR